MQMRNRFLWVSAVVLASLVPTLAAADYSCPVTTASEPPFVPSAPYEPNAPAGEFWYGTNALWAMLPINGVWSGLPSENGGYTNKLPLWKQGYDGTKEPQPDIILVLKRLDAKAPLVSSRGGTNAFADGVWTMLTGIDFPTAGCWEVTAANGGHTLTFVLSIQP
jgi:hypothetical protein